MHRHKGVDDGSRLRGELVLELPAEVTSGVLWEGGPKGFRHEVGVRGNRVRVTFEARSPVRALSGIDALLACVRVSEEVLKLVRSAEGGGGDDGQAHRRRDPEKDQAPEGGRDIRSGGEDAG